MGRLMLLALIGLAACETTESQTQREIDQWRGRPVSEFVARYSWAPEHVFDPTPGARTYVFRRPGCGLTIDARAAAPGEVYRVAHMRTDCGVRQF